MGFLKPFGRDIFTVAPRSGDPDQALNTVSKPVLQERLDQGGLLELTAVSGGTARDRALVLDAVLRQARTRNLPVVALSARTQPLSRMPLYNYDPFQAHTQEEAAFLLSCAANLETPGAAQRIAFSLDALLRHWPGHSLTALLEASCEELELEAQRTGPLPFAEREEFRNVFHLLARLRGLQPPGRQGASVASVLLRPGQLVLPHPLLWMMALAEIEYLCPRALVVCVDAPFARLPDRLKPLLDCGHLLLAAEDLPAELSDAEWEYLCGRLYTGVMFAHPAGMAAEKVARLYGMAELPQREYARGETRDWLVPWSRSTTSTETIHMVREYQVRPEIIQNLAPGQAMVSCGGLRRLTRFHSR